MKKLRNLLLSVVLLLGVMMNTACQEQAEQIEHQTATISAITTSTTTTTENETESTESETSTAATTPLPAAVVYGEAELFETAVSFSNGITVRLSLPEGFALAEAQAEASANYPPITGHEARPEGYCHIVKDGRAVGAVTTAGMDLIDFVEGQKESFLGGEHPTAMYSSFMLGSMYSWNVDYTNVTPVGELSGAATCLVYYRSDGLPEGAEKPHAKMEKAYESDFDDRVNYYNRGILAYNFDFETYIGVELDYDCVNDATQTAIAKTVQITDDGGGLQLEAINVIPPEVAASRLNFELPGQINPNGGNIGWLRINFPPLISAESKNDPYTPENYAAAIAAIGDAFPLAGMPEQDPDGYPSFWYFIDRADETNPAVVAAMAYDFYDPAETDPNEIFRSISQGTEYLFDIGLRYEVVDDRQMAPGCVTALTDVIYADGRLNHGIVSYFKEYGFFLAVELDSNRFTDAQARTIAESISAKLNYA
jgi:hypothetical protein